MKAFLFSLLTIFSIRSFATDQRYICFQLDKSESHGYEYIRMIYFGSDENYKFAILHPKNEQNYNINQVGKIEKVQRNINCRVINDSDVERCRQTPPSSVETNKYSNFTGEGRLDWVVFAGFSGQVKFLGDEKIYQASYTTCSRLRLSL